MQSPRTRGPLTPGGIDGVLSGGDTWMSRRRASEAGRGAFSTIRGDMDTPDGGGSKIKEEEEGGGTTSELRTDAKDPIGAGPEDERKSNTSHTEETDRTTAPLTSSMAGITLRGEGAVEDNAMSSNGAAVS